MLSPSADRNDAEAHAALTRLIQQETDRRGILTFARFMELALYAPGLGYYERPKEVIGRSGDFFTSVSVGRAFGELLACQFADWLEKTGGDSPVIVECGANDGRLAADILNALESIRSRRLKRLEYWILEASGARQARQRNLLAPWAERVRWFHSWTDLSSFRDKAAGSLRGVVFSNEFMDALPFHRVQWDRTTRRWNEMGVVVGKNGLEFARMPLSAPLQDYRDENLQILRATSEEWFWPGIPEMLLQVLPDGFTLEICPAAIRWWREAAKALDAGRLMAIDYGLGALEFFHPERPQGTARGYRAHRPVDNLLKDPGVQDITASVNFGALRRTGEAMGLCTDTLESQSRFLTRIALEHWGRTGEAVVRNDPGKFHLLTHPDHLGRNFSVLVQSRDINATR